ncbi:MAG: holin [Ruminococcaceae bacterium]|nr:holin [Oscillospiraceae bacterium]
MDFINDYIVLIVLAVCLCVGYILKNLIPTKKINRFIPLIMAVIGVVVNLWVNNFNLTPEILLGGMVSGLASTGMHQAFKQIIEKKKE